MSRLFRKYKGIVVAVVIVLAQVFSTMLPKLDASAEEKTYESEYTASVVIDGDGEKDSVRFLPSDMEYDEYKSLEIYVNGKKKAAVKTEFFSYYYKVLNLKGKTLLYVGTYWNNEDGIKYVYNYEGGKLVKVLDVGELFDARWASEPKVSGKKIKFTLSGNGAGIGYYAFQASYTWDGGKLKEDSKIHKVKEYHNFQTGETGVFTLKASNEFKIYSDEKCTKYLDTVPAGANVKLTKTYQEKG